jgi:CBS domain-containing protein
VHLVRLRNQCRRGGGGPEANRIDPRELNELDRHVLKEAFRQARKLQSRLALDHRL